MAGMLPQTGILVASALAISVFLAPGGAPAQSANTGPAGPQPIPIASELLVFNPEHPADTRIGRLEFMGGLILASTDRRFGGLSGLSVDADGAGFWAISDTGNAFRLDLAIDSAGRPQGVRQAGILPLLDEQGEKLTAKWEADAEALRRDENGGFWVSFERKHRVLHYPNGFAYPAEHIILPKETEKLQANGGIESLALQPGPPGTDTPDLLLLAEDPFNSWSGTETAIWRRQAGQWRRSSFALIGEFRPSDAVFLPDGDLLVLERNFLFLAGWETRLRLVPAAELQPDTVASGKILARWQRPYANDNLEGIDARRAADGSLWIYLVSDDNHMHWQRSLLEVMRLLPE